MANITTTTMPLVTIATTLLFVLLPLLTEASPAPLKFESEAGRTLVEKLYDMVSSSQVKKDVPFEELIHWHEAQGVYNSEIKLNFHGGPAFAEFRRLFKVFDNNMFATTWVTSNLLETFKYGGAPRPTEQQINLALMAIDTHVDKNAPRETVNKVFWSQVYNQTTDYWVTTPDNLLSLFKTTDNLPVGFLESVLKTLGLGELAKDIDELIKSKNLYKQAFRVPPDFDDTYVNLGLGALLFEMRNDFGSSWQAWHDSNAAINSALVSLKRHAYRPFSADRDANTIDPRTYYYLRGFLDLANSTGQDIALATTWIQSIKETRGEFKTGNPMPFNINNVDVTVAADVVFGLTSGVLTGLIEVEALQDPEISQIYLNTSSLLAYEIRTNLTSRPDLALTYYPSVMEYYWFVARTVSIMETSLLKGPMPLPVMHDVYEMLRNSCVGAMTDDVVSKAHYEEVEKYFLDDFLGNADKNIFNQSSKSYEDRMFTTVMAGNSLLYTWTVYDEDKGVNHWRVGTPDHVKALIAGINNWLSEYALSGKYKAWNAFFSGSVKGFTALPFWYPGNRFEFLNGTAIKDWSRVPTGEQFVYGVEGYIPKHQYDSMVQQRHFGVPTPTVFSGYNSGNGYFPFWSSESYTYSCVMLSLARFENIAG